MKLKLYPCGHVHQAETELTCLTHNLTVRAPITYTREIWGGIYGDCRATSYSMTCPECHKANYAVRLDDGSEI